MSMSVRADDIGLEYAGALGARGVVFVKDTDDVAPGPVMMFSAMTGMRKSKGCAGTPLNHVQVIGATDSVDDIVV